MVRKIVTYVTIVVLTLSLTACDTESFISVVDTSNQRQEVVDSEGKKDIISSREQFKKEYASIKNIDKGNEKDISLNIVSVDNRDSAEVYIKEFIKFISSEYRGINGVKKLEGYIDSAISDKERAMFDWWGNNVNQVMDTWYINTVAYNEYESYINTISRLKRKTNGKVEDADVAVKWHVINKGKDIGLKIKSASVVSLDEVKESLERVVSGKCSVVVYSANKAQGSEYNDCANYNKSSASKVLKAYKESVVNIVGELGRVVGTGFVVQSGYILTTYDNIYKQKKVSVSFVDGEVVAVDGIISADKEKNVCIIKLKERKGTKVTVADYANIDYTEPIGVISISSRVDGKGSKDAKNIKNVCFMNCGNIYGKLKNEVGLKEVLVRVPMVDGEIGGVVVNAKGFAIGYISSVDKGLGETGIVTSLDEVQQEIKYVSNLKWGNEQVMKFSSIK